MTIEEIQKYLNVGAFKSVCVDISHVTELLHYVRKVIIRRHNIVWIKFYNYGYEEGGIAFEGKFGSLKELIEALEEYLGKPFSDWHNFSSSGNYPDPPVNEKSQMSWEEIQAIAKALVPEKGNFS
jgi:uncharacterized protein YfkK (UPF0435 family)